MWGFKSLCGQILLAQPKVNCIRLYIYLALDNSFMTFNIEDGFENLASFQILYIECNCMVRCILFDRNGILQVVITQKDITVHLRIVDWILGGKDLKQFAMVLLGCSSIKVTRRPKQSLLTRDRARLDDDEGCCILNWKDFMISIDVFI